MSFLEERIQQVFQEVFHNQDLTVSDSTTSKDIQGWDSFAQVRLVIAFEEEFDIKFTTDEVATISSVAGLKDALVSKGVAAD
jgi:acyl carrier protein